MEALCEAGALNLEGGALLRELERLRRRLSVGAAAAVLEQARLQRRAAAKFERAAEMLFTADGLEQASGERVAAHSAARYEGCGRIADLCCGIGGDTLALARQAPVDAFDLDPVRLACAEHNARVHGLDGRVRFHRADVERLSVRGRSLSIPGPFDAKLPNVDAIFFDPGRRVGGRRIFALAEYRPPVALIDRWLPAVPAIGVKVAPGVNHDEIVWECEQEFVAEGGDLKAALLWFGPLASAARRASLLPSGATLTPHGAAQPECDEPLAWLYDPSPAVTRAGLIWELAALLGARQLDPDLAYLSGSDYVATPFARAFAVEAWLPFNLKRLKAALRERGVGRVSVQKRGSPIDTDRLERQLRLPGDERRVLVLTKLRGRPIAIICREPSSADPA